MVFKKISRFLRNERVTGIVIQNDGVWIEEDGKLLKTNVLLDDFEIENMAKKIIQIIGKENIQEPVVSAKLPRNFRTHIISPMISRKGTIINMKRDEKNVS